MDAQIAFKNLNSSFPIMSFADYLDALGGAKSPGLLLGLLGLVGICYLIGVVAMRFLWQVYRSFTGPGPAGLTCRCSYMNKRGCDILTAQRRPAARPRHGIRRAAVPISDQ